VKYLQEYKKFFCSILDPLERLDDLEVNLEDLDTHSTDHEANYDIGQISHEEYKLEAKELNDFSIGARNRFLFYKRSMRLK
jgi:hypothetical protein